MLTYLVPRDTGRMTADLFEAPSTKLVPCESHLSTSVQPWGSLRGVCRSCTRRSLSRVASYRDAKKVCSTQSRYHGTSFMIYQHWASRLQQFLKLLHVDVCFFVTL